MLCTCKEAKYFLKKYNIQSESYCRDQATKMTSRFYVTGFDTYSYGKYKYAACSCDEHISCACLKVKISSIVVAGSCQGSCAAAPLVINSYFRPVYLILIFCRGKKTTMLKFAHTLHYAPSRSALPPTRIAVSSASARVRLGFTQRKFAKSELPSLTDAPDAITHWKELFEIAPKETLTKVIYYTIL